MKDFLRSALSIGDPVVIMLPRYRELTMGKIVALTPKNVRVEYKHQGSLHIHLYRPEDMVKI